MGKWSLKPEKVGTMGPGVGSGVGEADGGSKKWEGTPALTQSILQSILNVAPLSLLAQGVTGIPFRRQGCHSSSIQEGACARLQEIQGQT